MKEDLEKYLKQKIVLDTRSALVYIGVLEGVTRNCVVLSLVDVHDSTDSRTSKELYVLESKTTGVKANRNLAYVNLDYVVSFSPLEQIKSY